MNIIERQLQLYLNTIDKWAMENGFKFSSSKIVGMYFVTKEDYYTFTVFLLYKLTVIDLLISPERLFPRK